MSPRLAAAIEIAVAAGRSTLAHFGQPLDIERKADASPVTVADRAAERLAREMLAVDFPNEAILGEEEGESGNSGDRWVLDPIDGTKSFVCGVPLYATLISYEQDGDPILGVIYLPALNELIYAERGGGCYWNGRLARVSTHASLEGSTVCSAGHKSMYQFGLSEGMERLTKRTMATRTWCDAYGHALVATGRVAAMIDPVVERYDISAIIPIIEEAGGTVSTLTGADPLQPAHANGKYQLVSSNGQVHKELLETLHG